MGSCIVYTQIHLLKEDNAVICAAVDPMREERFALVLHTGSSAWENGCDVEISSWGDCSYVVHPGLSGGRLMSQKYAFNLSAERLEKLISVIRKVGFFRLKELYNERNSRNCTQRYVKVVLDGESHVVNTRTCSPISEIEDIINAVNELLPQSYPKIQ